MQKFNTSDLFVKIKRKGIRTSRENNKTFNKFSYYQTINAYKSIFILDVKSFTDIENDINSSSSALIPYYEKYFNVKYVTKNEFILKIANEILKKYGFSKKQNLADCKLIITRLKYLHHIYDSKTTLDDFIRLYKFEHRLRSILLNYVLIIEESIKTVFTNVLNSVKEIDSNFLFNLNNYNLTEKQSEVVLSIKKVYDKLNNPYSKMFERKRKQELLPPYWILIQSLTMNETYNLISNLIPDHRDRILANLLLSFTDYTFDYDSRTTIDIQKVEAFSYIVSRIGHFRNLLAHNSPVFNYNVNDVSLQNFPNIEYENPKKKKEETHTQYLSRKTRIVASEFSLLRDLFGSDSYNLRTSYNNCNFNLGHMIYTIHRIMKRIDPKNTFKSEIIKLYSDYNIINTSSQQIPMEFSTINQINTDIKIIIQNLLTINLKNVSDLASSGQPYKSRLKTNQKTISDNIKSLKKIENVSNLKPIKKDYPPFVFVKNYTKYTGINKKFLTEL